MNWHRGQPSQKLVEKDCCIDFWSSKIIKFRSLPQFITEPLPCRMGLSPITACYPDLSANTLAQVILPFFSQQSHVLSLANWRQALPCKIFHQLTMHRVENGGGLCSTAIWHVPQAPDACSRLRPAWTVRLFQTGLHKTLWTTSPLDPTSDPVSPSQLRPFRKDLLRALQIPINGRSGLNLVNQLWKRLLQSMDDPDAPIVDELKTGVRLGVHNVIALLHYGHCRNHLN